MADVSQIVYPFGPNGDPDDGVQYMRVQDRRYMPVIHACGTCLWCMLSCEPQDVMHPPSAEFKLFSTPVFCAIHTPHVYQMLLQSGWLCVQRIGCPGALVVLARQL